MKIKVRKDFDPGKIYRVNVSGCTEEEKKEVQQAFFDAGFPWDLYGEVYKYMDADQYTNTKDCGYITTYIMYGDSLEGVNMTAKEFLNLVYEPEQVGHVHCELMAHYAEDAKTHAEPWRLWEIHHPKVGWQGIGCNPTWVSGMKYRRKPKTHTVNGAEIPDLRVKPEEGEYYYLANPTSRSFFTSHKFGGDRYDKVWFERGITYQHTVEGKQAAILHSQAMLGIIQE